MPLTENEAYVATVFKTISGFLTLFSSLFFLLFVMVKSIITHKKVKDRCIHTRHGLNILQCLLDEATFKSHKSIFVKDVSIRILTMMQLSALLTSIGDAYGLYTYKYDTIEGPPSFLCVLQALQTQYFDWAMLMWSFVVAVWLVHTIIFEKGYSLPLEIICHVASWGIPLIFTILPVIGLTYGKSGNWCWISSRTPLGVTWVLAAFYIPLWILIAVIFVMYTLIVARVVRLYVRMRYAKGGVRRELRKRALIVGKLLLYPAIFIIVWTVPTINRIYEASTKDSVFWLTLLHSIMSPLQGFLNTIVYFLDPTSCMCKRKRAGSTRVLVTDLQTQFLNDEDERMQQEMI